MAAFTCVFLLVCAWFALPVIGGKAVRAMKRLVRNVMKKDKASAMGKNKAFHAQGLKYAMKLNRNQRPRASRPGLVSLKQEMDYEDVCQYTEYWAKQVLQEHNVLRDGPYVCWHCWGNMTPEDRSVDAAVRCHNCGARCRMSMPRLAHTPLYNLHTHGEEFSYKQFLQVCYLVSIKVPRDCAMHLIKGISETRLHNWYRDITHACAAAEYWRGSKITFAPGILEFDGFMTEAHKATPAQAKQTQTASRKQDVAVARSVLKTNPGESRAVKKALEPRLIEDDAEYKIHRGRFCVVTNRDTKEQCLVPMLASFSKKGEQGARLPPEGFLETFKIAKSKVSQYHVCATDGAQGFRATFRALHVAHSSAAVHGANLFSPVEDIDKSSLTPDGRAAFSRLTKTKQAKSTRHAFRLVAGDNKAESIVSQTKGQLRRTLKLGNSSRAFEHDPALSAQYVHHQPGLLSVLLALSQYRTAVQTRSNPRDSFKEFPWKW